MAQSGILAQLDGTSPADFGLGLSLDIDGRIAADFGFASPADFVDGFASFGSSFFFASFGFDVDFGLSLDARMLLMNNAHIFVHKNARYRMCIHAAA